MTLKIKGFETAGYCPDQLDAVWLFEFVARMRGSTQA
jgi:hypothetical protein